MPDAANRAKPIDPDGGLYQRRALMALPILVRQAWAAQTIYYGDTAAELGMANPRNLDFVLGSVGKSIQELSREWNEKIPPLQAIVINKGTELPGEGFADFAPEPSEFRKAPVQIRRRILRPLLSSVYSYPRWADVLRHFGAAIPAPPSLDSLVPSSARLALGAQGESEMHKEFKDFLAKNPQLFGLTGAVTTYTEYCFPSSDRADILFVGSREWLVVEAKSRISPDFDIVRGIFQCVKYQALLDAVISVERRNVHSRVILAIEADLPAELRGIVNTLGVTVVEHSRTSQSPGAR